VARTRHEARDAGGPALNEDAVRERLQAGARHRDAGEAAEARACAAEVLAADSGNAEAAGLMAALAADDNDFGEGHRWARRALEADPKAAAAHYTLGRLYQAEGRLAEAEASYLLALDLAPDSAKAHNNLGCVQHMLGKLDLAVASYRRALVFDPSLPQANQNLAAITSDPAQAERAIAGYLRHRRQNPGDAGAHNNLGNVFRELGRHREALESFDAAIRCNPALAEAHFSRALQLLTVGRLVEGWREHEWRWKVHALGAPRIPGRKWQGEDLKGGTLLLHAEQGMGDTLQFARYATLAAARCGKLVLECQRPLAPLLATLAGVSRVVPEGDSLPPFDAQLPMMSLPNVFETSLQTIPWDGPYLRADPRRASEWRGRLARGARRHIGLVWSGRPQQRNNHNRSIPVGALAPLASARDVAFYSLQLGEAGRQAAAAPDGLKMIDLTAGIRDFADTAAFAGNLDLLISVDTSVAHLAGAMGVPTWLIAAYSADWRWLLDREDCPWYPSVRIFRQASPGDWPGVIERVAAALA